MDRDGDGRVTYGEFLNFINPKIKGKEIPQPERQPY
jgi:hypothetical protein